MCVGACLTVTVSCRWRQQIEANKVAFERNRVVGSTAANPLRSAKPLTIPVSPRMKSRERLGDKVGSRPHGILNPHCCFGLRLAPRRTSTRTHTRPPRFDDARLFSQMHAPAAADQPPPPPPRAAPKVRRQPPSSGQELHSGCPL